MTGVCPFDHTVLDPDVLSYFARLRAEGRVHARADGTYAISHYDDVLAALKDPLTFSSNHELKVSGVPLANQRLLIYADDPDHLELRQLVNRAWTPRAVLELEEPAASLISEALGAVPPDEPFDMVTVGEHLGYEIFALAVGVPGEPDRVRSWLRAAETVVRPKVNDLAAFENMRGQPVKLQAETFARGMEDMRAHLESLEDKAQPLTPFERAVVDAVGQSSDNLERILLRVLPAMLVGGVSTLGHIFPNVTSVLIDHPDAWESVRNEPPAPVSEWGSDLVEEILRLRGVVQGMPRVLARDVEIGGSHIPAGTTVHLHYLSANFDVDAFDDPEEVRERGSRRHLTFGFGAHTCMGQSLVRVVVKRFLMELTARFDRLEAVPAPTDWGSVGVYLTPDSLPVIGRARS